MCVPVNEQETVITFSRDSNEATIYTSDTTVMTKLDKLCSSSDEWKLVRIDKAKMSGNIVSKNYKVKKSLVSFRTRKTKREMTDEQREAAAERLRKARGKKKNEEVQN